MTDKKLFFLLFLILLPVLDPPPSPARPGGNSVRTLRKTVLEIPGELLTIGGAPFREPATGLKYAALLGGLILIDKPVTKYFQDDIEGILDLDLPTPPRDLFGKPESDIWLMLGLGGAYAGSFLAADARGQTAAIRAVKAGAYSVLFAHLIIKSISGRNRPYRYLSKYDPQNVPEGFSDDPWDFGNWHRPDIGSTDIGTGFPSFHYTLFFSIARVYQRTYDTIWIPYTTMSILLMNDIRGHNHWVSEMVAGALLGTYIGSVLTRDTSTSKQQITIQPVLSGDRAGIAFSGRF